MTMMVTRWSRNQFYMLNMHMFNICILNYRLSYTLVLSHTEINLDTKIFDSEKEIFQFQTELVHLFFVLQEMQGILVAGGTFSFQLAIKK